MWQLVRLANRCPALHDAVDFPQDRWEHLFTERLKTAITNFRAVDPEAVKSNAHLVAFRGRPFEADVTSRELAVAIRDMMVEEIRVRGPTDPAEEEGRQLEGGGGWSEDDSDIDF